MIIDDYAFRSIQHHMLLSILSNIIDIGIDYSEYLNEPHVSISLYFLFMSEDE